MEKHLRLFVVFILHILIVVVTVPLLLGQIPSYQPQPYLKAPGYSGPPLSTALPSSFSHGIQMGSSAATGTPVGSGSGFGVPMIPTQRFDYTRHMIGPQPYLNVDTFTGQMMANYGLYRGVTRGLRF